MTIEQTPIWVPFVAASLTGGFTVVAVLIAQRLILRNQLRATCLAKRQEAYAGIQGARQLLWQVTFSQVQATIQARYFNAAWGLRGQPPDSFEFHEGEKATRRSEELALEVARARQLLAGYLGLAQANFPAGKRLGELAEKCYRLRAITVADPPPGMDATFLLRWMTVLTNDAQRKVDDEYGATLVALADELVQHLHD